MLPHLALAVSVANVDVLSTQGQGLQGYLEVRDWPIDSQADTTVALASAAEFAAAGLSRYQSHEGLSFSVELASASRSVIRLSSRRPIRERDFNLLLKLQSGAQQTLLPVQFEVPFPRATEIVDNTVMSRPADTLWRIAMRYYPSSSLDVNQFMLAVVDLNPFAFADGNVNGLKAGYRLRLPDMWRQGDLSEAQAARAVANQNRSWQPPLGARDQYLSAGDRNGRLEILPPASAGANASASASANDSYPQRTYDLAEDSDGAAEGLGAAKDTTASASSSGGATASTTGRPSVAGDFNELQSTRNVTDDSEARFDALDSASVVQPAPQPAAAPAAANAALSQPKSSSDRDVAWLTPQNIIIAGGALLISVVILLAWLRRRSQREKQYDTDTQSVDTLFAEAVLAEERSTEQLEANRSGDFADAPDPDLQANAARDAEIDEQADDAFESDAPETVSAASDEHEMNAENMTDFPLASASEAPSNVQTSAVEREADIESEVDELEASMGDSVADEAEVNRTRLSLAAAYIEMGDPRAAKEILNDVLQEGNADQRSQAQELLDELEKPE